MNRTKLIKNRPSNPEIATFGDLARINCSLMKNTNSVLSRRVDDVLWIVGLTSRQMMILDVIAEHKTLSEEMLAGAIGKDLDAIKASLGPLASRGIVVINIDGDDRRVGMVALTDDGRLLLNHARSILKAFDAALCAMVEGDDNLLVARGSASDLIGAQGVDRRSP